MPEEVRFLEDKLYVHVHSYGVTTIDDWRRSLAAIESIYNENGTRKVIVDIRERQSDLNAMDLYDFGKELSSKFQYAIVAEKKSLKDQHFLEIVGQNRGKRIKVFSDYDEAEAWLGIEESEQLQRLNAT